jgi:molybdopterin-containing oxidoreductase family iron-sulfur binding subunit
MAVHTLNTLVGAIDVPGGVLLERKAPFGSLDELGEKADVERSSPTVEELATWVLESKQPPIDVCFIHNADPVFTSVEGERVAEALRKIPLVVSTSPVLTDSVDAAHVVLPGSVWMEQRCDSTTVDGEAQPIVSLSAAAAPPRAATRNSADVALTLAREVGGAVAGRFPWGSYDDVVRDRLEQIVRAGVGDTFSEEHRSTWAQLLERGGWRVASYKDAATLQEQMDARGGWWDPVYYHGEWRRLVPGGDHRVDLETLAVQARPQAARVDENDDNALLLHLYAELALSTRVTGSLPYLQDAGSPLGQAGWVTSAEINPKTAQRLALVDGDSTEIEGARGKVKVRVRVSPAIRPDVIAVHTGGGRVRGGRYAAGIGANPLRLLRIADAGERRRPGVAQTVVRVQGKA